MAKYAIVKLLNYTKNYQSVSNSRKHVAKLGVIIDNADNCSIYAIHCITCCKMANSYEGNVGNEINRILLKDNFL